VSKIAGPLAEEGGATEILATERVSATRAAPVSGSRPRGRRVPPAEQSLAEMQAWFFNAVSAPGTLASSVRAVVAATGTPLEAVLTPGPALGARDRLGVYHFAYRARLIDALADDFPAVQYAMGAAAFARFADRVITEHPSRTANLNRYGAVLIEALATARRVPHRSFLLDLARLEWALVEAIHAPPPPRLEAEALAAIPAEAWANLRFLPNPALGILASAWPVNRFFSAWRRDEAPSLPARAASATVVYRVEFTLWRMDLSPMTHTLLQSLLDGVPLGEALAPLEGRAGADRVMEWFSAWVRGGFFAALR
jgi:hypothetical protein